MSVCLQWIFCYPTRGLYAYLVPPFPWICRDLQKPTKCSCNDLHFYFATTYILVLQLSTFLFYNKQLQISGSFNLRNDTQSVVGMELKTNFPAPLRSVSAPRSRQGHNCGVPCHPTPRFLLTGGRELTHGSADFG